MPKPEPEDLKNVTFVTDKDIQEFAEHMLPLFREHGLPTDEVLQFSQGFMTMMEMQLRPAVEHVILEVYNMAIDGAMEAFVGHSNFALAYKRVKSLRMTKEEFDRE